MSLFDDGNMLHSTTGDLSGVAASAPQGKVAQMPSKISPQRNTGSSGSSKQTKNSEKIGRWTEEEHKVFLEGLVKHGKQWKTIANMIGTRTVVQVRTHAQKHYMKLERNKSKSSDSLVSSVDAPGHLANKRKSLPSMPLDQQRHKKVSKLDHTVKRDSMTKEKPRISISLSNIAAYTNDSLKASTPTGDLPNTSTFSVSSSSENLSTISPTGVNELDLGTWGSTDSSSADLENFYQDCSVDDPLEWFNLDSEIPIFPDFHETLDIPLPLSHSKGDANDSSMPWMDPKITVQSLFIDEQL